MPELGDPIKTIFVSVFDMLGNQLAATTDEGDISVVAFKYVFDDEDDDICTIKLQMSDPNALDKFRIDRGMKLQIVWGYLGNPISPIATVVIRDMVSKYGSNVIYTELQCTDYLTALKTMRSADIGRGSLIDYIRAQVYGKWNFVIWDRGVKLYGQVKRTEGQDDDQVINISVEDKYGSLPIVEFDPLKWDSETGSTSTKVTDRWSEVGHFLVKADHPVRRYLEEVKDIPTSNRPTYVVIQDLLKKCPRGPWFVTGRGGTLYIHNRNLGKTAYTEYRYHDEPGRLIDFQATTKYENFDKQVISYAGMDPKNRTNMYVDDYRKALYSQRNPKEILEDKEITDEQKTKEIKEYLKLRQIPYAIFGIVETEGYIVDPTDVKKVRFVEGHLANPFVLKSPTLPVGARDYSGDVNTDPYVRGNIKKFDPIYHDVALRVAWLTMPLSTYDEAVASTNNRQRELAMDKEEGKMIIEGDPSLIGEQTIRISNVYKQHEGHYYIKKCSHVITQQGYKVNLECLKVVPEALMTTIGRLSKEEYNALDGELQLDFDKQQKREQLLFGSDVSVSFNEKTLVGGPMGEHEPTIEMIEKKTVTLKDLQEMGLNEDESVDELIRLYNQEEKYSYSNFSPEKQ